MPIKNGDAYIRSINRLNPAIIYGGKQISGPLSEHTAFRGLLRTQASLYDMQGEEPYRQRMTYPSPRTGEPVGLSFLMPKTKSDLRKRTAMTSLWASRHYGFLGRSPDYMNIALTAYASAAAVIRRANLEHADNLIRYYEYCREHDITLSHAFVQPAGSRISGIMDPLHESTAAKVVDADQDGIIVCGAFFMSTQAATSEEILVFPPPFSFFQEDRPYVFAFAIPIDTPGVTLVCRESYVQGDSQYDYPLSSRFEEMDAMVLFDHVRVPQDRIFIYGDAKAADELIRESQFHAQVSHQTLCRYIAKTMFFLGTAEKLAKLADFSSDSMDAQIAEMIVVLEILKSMLVQAEQKAKRNKWGIMIPDRNTLLAVNSYFPKAYTRMVEIIQSLASSRLVMIPSEQDFQSDVSADLCKYLKISDTEARDVVALNRLAWELSASSFAGRQEQYERFFFGGTLGVTNRLCKQYSGRADAVHTVDRFLQPR